MKMVIIGAGSGFGSCLSVDVLSRLPLQDSTIALVDINAEKLEAVRHYVQQVVDANDLPAKVIAATDRTEVLKDADFVVIAVAIGGPAYFGNPYKFEIEIPAKYGIHQTVGDTVNPAGIFRALRTAPEMIAMAEDISKLAPNATILNYTNPMAILTWAITERAEVPVVGLCHSVQGTAKALASYIGAPFEETEHWVAGINHMAWFLEFTHNKKDALPRLKQAMKDPEIFAQNPIRFEIMHEFGYFVTESSRHMSEYVPWYQHEKASMEQYQSLMVNTENKIQNWFEDMGKKADDAESTKLVRSHEYASEIMEAITTDTPIRFNGSVLNNGLIDNLPEGCCVEVPILTDGLGLHPCKVGEIPAQCAALNRTNINVQELTVKAIQTRDKQTAFQAVLMDPSVGAMLSIKQARDMFEEIWAAEGELLEAYGREPVMV